MATGDIGIVVGLATEARIARRAGWRVAIGGGTASGATAAATTLIEGGCAGLISFGLAGGLDPALRPGAIVVPTAVIAGDERYMTDPGLSNKLGGPTAHVMYGDDAIIADVAAKRVLREQTGAAAVDLESGAVARVATTHGVPFAVLRAICDPADRALPPAALLALDANGEVSIWGVLGSLAVHPAQLPALFALARYAAAAKRSLAARIRQVAESRT